MSKYALLPDIDTAPDVYETPDVPDLNLKERDDESDNELLTNSQSTNSRNNLNPSSNIDIISSNLDQSIAKKRFQAASQLDTSNTDFSNSLLRKHPRRSSARYFETSEYSILPRGFSIKKNHNDYKGSHLIEGDEKPIDRLRRLRFELEELEEELSKAVPEDEETGRNHLKNIDKDDQTFPDQPINKGDNNYKKNYEKKLRTGPSPTELLIELQHLQHQFSKLSTSINSTDPEDPDSLFDLRQREAHVKSLLQQLTDQKKVLPNQPLESAENSAKRRDDDDDDCNKVFDAENSNNINSTTTIITKLDGRLDMIERLLGSSNLLQSSSSGDVNLPAPLLVTISKLEHQLSLLTQPRHLDSISRRVKVIVTDLERVHEARRKLTDQRPLSIALASGITVVTQNQISSSASAQQATSSSNIPNNSLNNLPGVISSSSDQSPNLVAPDSIYKLERLYNLLPRIDPLLPLVPHLLSRLRSLSKLHSESMEFRDRLNESNRSVLETLKRTKGLEEVFCKLEKSFEENEVIVKKNLESVEGRIEKILESIEKLKQS
ncbi:hypothetical protein BY996DRAFT_4587680 [Phakopsora pachyrhizi]|nr:hypothetical protein BY996DRAFT_4587680 [Phakopsora pachyrhizi]